MSAQKVVPGTSQQRAVLYRTTDRPRSGFRKLIENIWLDAVSLIVIGIIFVVPFIFILLTAAKTQSEAALFQVAPRITPLLMYSAC